MIRNGKHIPTGAELTADVCIVGTGPAGVVAANYLQQAGKTVILIEGSREYGVPSMPLDPRNDSKMTDSWDDKVKLYNGDAEGLFASNEPEFLILPYNTPYKPAWERERVYGGTSTHWGGQSRPLDPITFEKRENFPGWPIDREELQPHYDEAARLCLLNPDFGSQYWADQLDAQVPELDGFNAEMYQFMGPNKDQNGSKDFSRRQLDGIAIGETSVDVIINASLLEIEHQQGSVNALRVASMDDGASPKPATEFTIKSKAYVLACGAVANARQLLLSNAGNEKDQVGRYFMCHPLSQSGVISVWGSYLTSDESRYMNGIGKNGQKWSDSNGVTLGGRFIPNADTAKEYGIGRCWFWAGGGQYYFEMTPNPNSRVTLADSTDPVFGQYQTKVNWLLTDADEKTYNTTTKLFKGVVEERGGNVSYPAWQQVKAQLVVNGHHIGTTRMSSDPCDGVVDANLKVHSLDNLYVAGSSVFSSTGISNPTFTIITLSVRLGKYLSNIV